MEARHRNLCVSQLHSLYGNLSTKHTFSVASTLRSHRYVVLTLSNAAPGKGDTLPNYYASQEVAKRRFLLSKSPDGILSLAYIMPDERLLLANAEQKKMASSGMELLRIDNSKNRLIIFPKNTGPGHENFFQSKYENIRQIILDGFSFSTPESEDDIYDLLDELPSGFCRNPDMGLGFKPEYDVFINAIEQIPGLVNLLLTKNSPSSIDGETYILSYKDYEVLRKATNRIQNEARRLAREEKSVLAHNTLLTNLYPEDYPEKCRPYRKDTIFKILTGHDTKNNLSSNDKAEALSLVSASATDIVKKNPHELMRLHDKIELVTLDDLIGKITIKMSQSKQKENDWQTLFKYNPFILSLAFSLPITVFGDQVSVSGMRFNGSGETIADFVFRNGLTNNLTLIEIKTPSTKLLGKNAYRRDIFVPSQDLSGSINQVLYQRYQLQKNIASLKENSRQFDIESYAIKCLVIVGRTPESEEQRKSLELFRNNLNDVLIVTFDELLKKLELLRDFLRGGPKEE